MGSGSSNDVTSCLWDIERSAQATSAGGTGATTAEMQNASTFLKAGWDFIDETTNGTEDNGKEIDAASSGLHPVGLQVRVLKGQRAYRVGSRGMQGWVGMTEEPFENTDSMITLIYELEGLAAKN